MDKDILLSELGLGTLSSDNLYRWAMAAYDHARLLEGGEFEVGLKLVAELVRASLEMKNHEAHMELHRSSNPKSAINWGESH